MTKDFADFLDSLNSEGVAYVVIGGMAVLSHVPYRTTRDLDVLIEPTLDNACRARRAVGRWGGFEPDFSAEEFISGDILSFGGLPTHFAGIEDLIAMKEAAGRPEKDVPDLKRLRRLRDSS